MKLTGKCKDSFLKHIWQKHGFDSWDELLENEIILNALIIEFFDLVGIYVNAIKYTTKWVGIAENGLWISFDNRTDAINDAIHEANEIYNDLND